MTHKIKITKQLYCMFTLKKEQPWLSD